MSTMADQNTGQQAVRIFFEDCFATNVLGFVCNICLRSGSPIGKDYRSISVESFGPPVDFCLQKICIGYNFYVRCMLGLVDF